MARIFVLYILLAIIMLAKARGFSTSNSTKKQRSVGEFSPTPNLGITLHHHIPSSNSILLEIFHYFFLSIRRRCAVNKNFFKKCDPCPNDIKCVPTIQCPAHVRMNDSNKPQICDLPHGGHGFCCTTGSRFSAPSMNHFE